METIAIILLNAAVLMLIVTNVALHRWLKQTRQQRDEALAQYDRLARETFISSKPSRPEGDERQ